MKIKPIKKKSKPSSTKKGAPVVRTVEKRTNLSVSVPPRAVSFICGLNDPFCEHATNTRYGDSGKVRSIQWTRRLLTTLVTNGEGNVASLIAPSYLSNPVLPTASVDGFGFSPANATNAYAISAQSVRLTSVGFIVRAISAPLYRSGLVKMRVFSATTGTKLGYVQTFSYYCDESLDIAMADMHEVAGRLGRLDDSALLFRKPNYYGDVDTGVVEWVSPGFQCIAIHLVGGQPDTAVYTIETVEHWEVVMDDEIGFQTLATYPPATSAVLKDVADEASSTLKTIYKYGIKELGAAVVGVAKKAISARLGPATRLIELAT